ncbi:hypothetical protein LJC45_05990, partial [Alistipes sp. OttesenSCG-928-B03]|nr:hypothetical protein [Alistipes sp. OttesenSCG-928-B03]
MSGGTSYLKRTVGAACMAALVVCLFLTGCSVTRYVPEGSYLLNRNVIVTDHSVPVGERVTAEEVDRFVRQTPARKLLRTNTLLAIWSMNDTTSNSLPNRIARGLGSAPTVLDSAMIYRSASNIESYLRSRGYYDSQLEWKVETRKRKAKVTYAITQGEPYRIGDVRYVFRDEHLRPVVLQDTTATLLHTGDVFDIGVLNAERSRISDDLRNRGYYNFSVNNINYLADTTRGNRTADLTLILRQYLSGYMADGQPEYENNTIYRLGPVYINPEYDPAAVIADPEYYNRLDTLEYMGLNILHSGKPRIRGKVLRRTVKLYQNNFYSARDVDEASADLMRLGYFRSAAIVFDDVTDSLQAGKTTYIGSDDQPTDQTTEGYLACRINCVPSMRQSYKVDFEGSMASNFFGIAATLGYQNRNLFRGAELLDISLTGRYEFSRQTKQTGSYEIGANVSLSFPHFLFPWNLNAKGRALVPRTRIEASLQYQHRQVYHRTLSGVRLAWSWNNRRNSSFILRPVDVNLIRVSFIDQDFLATLKNKYLRESYQSQLVPGLSGSYIYNTQLRNPGANANSMVFRFNFETVGNLFAGLSRAFSEPYFDEALDSKYYRFFGMRFTQYVRLEASLSNRIVTGRKSSFVWRV